MQNENRNCQNCKKEFVIETEDFNFYEKIKVPPPTFCPPCRAQRRFAFRNERKLFKVKDAFTGKDIFSLYPEQAGRKMINAEEWYGDGWDAMDYGRDVDFSRNILDQLFELDREVPALNLNVSQMVRSEYCANATGLKDCYLLFASQDTENSLYGINVDRCHDCVDNDSVSDSEKCYESLWLEHCYQCYFTTRSMESQNLYFCRGCVSCSNCIGSVNLRNQSYCIFNKQYTKEEYEKEFKTMKLDTISGIKNMQRKSREFWNTQINKAQTGLKNLNCTGSYVSNSKNAEECFLIQEGENIKYCQNLNVPKSNDCIDVSFWGDNTELCYETCGSGENAYNVKFCWDCWPNVRDSEYSMHLRSCSDCFACVGLKKKQYCILNKQYSKEEYFELVAKIKKHMDEVPFVDKKGRVYKYGEYFPIEFSPYGYNNTMIANHFKVSKEEADREGYPWIEVPRGEYKITKNVIDLPDAISEVDESILKEVVGCESCNGAYRITEAELNFLKKENLPLPTLCIECRHDRRVADRLKMYLYERRCMCGGVVDDTGLYANNTKHAHGDGHCRETFKTGYSPESPEIIYCEKCYQAEVY